ncbi:MAG: hypothetical protein AABX90_04230 [Nanoarchaeota archaeon]
MDKIFEVVDKTGRKIRLTKKQWDHIKHDHPEIENAEVVKETIEATTKITQPYEGTKHYYYKYYKHRKDQDKYLLVIVNYLNGEGFIITAYYIRYIR